MDIVIYSLMFFALTCIGSFIGVCFERIPEGESIIKGRSHCESCGKTLKGYELVPIISYSYPAQGVEYVILAVPYEVYKSLQEQLDETIAGVIANVRHAAEAFMKNNEFAANGMLSFEKIYQDILYQLMRMSNTVIGFALNEKSQIVKNISDVSYEGLNIDQNFDEDEDDDSGGYQTE